MSRQRDGEPETRPEEQEVLRLLTTLEPPVVEPTLAHFRSRVQARIAQRQMPRPLGWGLKWRPVWALVPVVGLVLSLGLNGWLGYQTFARRPPELPLPTRSSAVATTEAVLQGDYAAASGQFSEAIDAYETALQATGEPVGSILIKLAGVYVKQGQARQAHTAATAALMIAPREARAYWYRGRATEALGDQTQAMQDWRRAAQLGDREAQQALQARGETW